MADDAFPITNSLEEGENIGILYVEDFELYNKLLAGHKVELSCPNPKEGPPYWLLIDIKDL